MRPGPDHLWRVEENGFRGSWWTWWDAHHWANSQAVQDRYKVLPEPLPLNLVGHTPTAGVPGLSRAQDRCSWDITGMLRLLRAIEDAPDLTPRQQARSG